MSQSVKIGVDIGGTFTDVAVEDGPSRWSVKVPTTHAAPEDGVLEGVTRGLAAAGRTLRDVSLLVHGTTLATNALIERKGSRTALLTTMGFRDCLEMGNEGRFDQYDIRAIKPEPLIPRHLRFTVPERLRFDGTVVQSLDLSAVADAATQMRDAGVEAVAVAFLHAYANGNHERSARDILASKLPAAAFSLSHEVSPEMREYERVSTTCANAYLQPIVSQYLLRLEARLRNDGLGGPMLLILSSGSLTTVETASRFPIRLLESGPAGGAIFAGDIAARLALRDVLSFDVGGTTAKFCMIDDGQPKHALSFEVARTYRFKKGSGLPVRIPVVDLVEIGAGGGSIARVDAVGRVAIGPDSAGSEPGPACYARGGTAATVTDCDVALGKIDPATFAGGTMPLDAGAAATAIESSLAAVGLSTIEAAYAVGETVTEMMAAAARVHAAEIGADIRRRTLIAFGGAAPLHAARFAEKLGISHVIVPVGAGVGSAIGFLRAPIAYGVVRTIRATLPCDVEELEPTRQGLREMEDIASAVVRLASHREALQVRRTAFMRYVGQGHEIEVSVETHPEHSGFGEDLLAAFEETYARTYGRAMAENKAEVTAWSVRVEALRIHRQRPADTPQAVGARAVIGRRVYNGAAAAWQVWPEYDRSALPLGTHGAGPAILAEAETTTIVPPGFSFSIDGEGFIHLRREALP
jgi:N-methylhydantoinase A